MGIFNKIKWILGILVVFLLIISTNIIDRDNFSRVRNSVETIYEDRLVAKDILFDLSGLIHKKELAYATGDEAFFETQNAVVNQEMQKLITQFRETELTTKEESMFSKFQENVEELLQIDPVKGEFASVDKNLLQQQLKKVEQNINNLSDLQLREGRRQLSISRKALETVDLFTQVEIYLLIFLAIVIQIIVIYTPGKKK